MAVRDRSKSLRDHDTEDDRSCNTYMPRIRLCLDKRGILLDARSVTCQREKLHADDSRDLVIHEEEARAATVGPLILYRV